MKKSLLALAVLGAFAGGAVAQSSVTLYGTISQGITKGNDGTASNPGTVGDVWAVEQGFASRLGFRGNEDLGGGLSAQFQIEHRFTPDTGVQTAPTFWQGRTYVQLSGGFGSVYLGREYSPAFWIANKMDAFGWNTVGQAGSKQWAGYGVPAGTTGVRVANAVGYKSPKLGGLTFNADVGLGEGAPNGRNQGFNVEYGAGPLYAGFAYDRITEGVVGGVSSDGNSLFNLGVAYDFGFVRPMFYYGQAKLNVVGGEDKNKFYSIGATAPVGPGKLKAQVYRLNLDAGGDETKFAVGYDYPLSKRTFIYVDASSAKKDDVGGVDFSNKNGFDLGIQHTF